MKRKNAGKNASKRGGMAAKIIAMIVVAELAGAIGSIFTFPAIQAWYSTITKPAWTPPNFVFGPVWTALFLLMGIAAGLVWASGSEYKRRALGIYGIQLVLNVLWSILFFGLQSPFWAFVEIVVLWIAILAAILAFKNVDRRAAYLLLPYIAWVTIAAMLNLSVWLLN